MKNKFGLLAITLMTATALYAPLGPIAAAQETSSAVSAHSAPVNDGLPLPGFVVEPGLTALVITDPQVDFLSEDGVTWGVVGQSVTENGVVENLETLMRTATETGMPMFISPHWYYPHDHKWKFEGALETLMHAIDMFDRSGQLDLTGFDGSGADWLEQYKPYINNENAVVTSPHKIYGPETNDLVLQLRKAGISKVILAGMSANLCTESHLRELVEQGFEVMVVTNATAGAITPHYNGYEAALTNFRMIASDVKASDRTVAAIQAAYQ